MPDLTDDLPLSHVLGVITLFTFARGRMTMGCQFSDAPRQANHRTAHGCVAMFLEVVESPEATLC